MVFLRHPYAGILASHVTYYFGDGSGALLEELREEANRVLQDCLADEISEIKLLQEHLHDEVGQLIYDRTHRRPMILPVVVEV